MWEIWSLVSFYSFEAPNDAFEVKHFQGLIFYTLAKTLVACRAMQLKFLKVETLLKGKFSSGIEGALASTLNHDFNWKQLSEMILCIFLLMFSKFI